jgi:hypothetical protein
VPDAEIETFATFAPLPSPRTIRLKKARFLVITTEIRGHLLRLSLSQSFS